VNLHIVMREMGRLLLVLSLCLLVVGGFSAWRWAGGSIDDELAAYGLGAAAGVGAVLGAVFYFVGRAGTDTYLGRREAMLLVALTWIVGAGISALPYFLWAWLEGEAYAGHIFRSFAGCYFEAMSGLTTTGATVLGDPGQDIESLPKGLLLWRAITHWLGGLGIVVLFVAVLPILGVGGKKLFSVENSAQKGQGVKPRIAETARTLWMIYLGLTVTSILLLRLCGMPWFESVCHTFSTLATGGFSTYNASMGFWHGWPVLIVTTVFMIAAGVNFGLYYHLTQGRWKRVVTDPELRVYLGMITVGTIWVVWHIWGNDLVITDGTVIENAGVMDSLKHGLFQVVSLHSGTGYATVDYDRWDFVAHAFILFLMFIGGSAGSTAGGLKVIRLIVAFKVILAEVEKVFRPNVIRAVRVGKSVVDQDTQRATLVYVMIIFALTIIGSVLLMVFEQQADHELTYTGAVSAAVATLNNVGPGFGRVGPVNNFGFFTAPSLTLMSLLMMLGRLEVYALFVLFVPTFWRGD